MEANTTRSVARARIGAGVAVAALLLPFGGYGLARAGAVPEGTPIVLGLLSAIVGPLLLPAPCEEQASLRHSSSRPTARTLTGAQMRPRRTAARRSRPPSRLYMSVLLRHGGQ